eukprot:gene6192-biopygen13553
MARESMRQQPEQANGEQFCHSVVVDDESRLFRENAGEALSATGLRTPSSQRLQAFLKWKLPEKLGRHSFKRGADQF